MLFKIFNIFYILDGLFYYFYFLFYFFMYIIFESFCFPVLSIWHTSQLCSICTEKKQRVCQQLIKLFVFQMSLYVCPRHCCIVLNCKILKKYFFVTLKVMTTQIILKQIECAMKNVYVIAV